jgi:acetoin utilization deacetylase AcuC-like enzyme
MHHPVSRRNFLEAAKTAALGLCVSPLWSSLVHVSADSAKNKNVGELVGSNRTGLVRDDRYLLHTQGAGHPESPERLKAIQRRLRNSGLEEKLRPIRASVDPDASIRMVHSGEHIEMAARQAHDDAICRLAVSGALSAVDAVCSGKVQNAFCAIRPPGHHAANNGEFGFCFYNNIAIAARYAQKQHNLNKILIVDWDYHHGDGTEWAFYDDPAVLVFSTHALYAFPGSGAPDKTGEGQGRGYNINVPLPRGATDEAILRAFKERLLPAAEKFQPDLVLISAGFDARKDDLLGDFNITDEGFAQLTRMVMAIADQHANSRIVSILEGGYNTEGLALGVEAHLEALGA